MAQNHRQNDKAPATSAAQKAFAKAGIFRWADLLLHFPLRYEDWHNASAIASLQNGETALVEGEITDARETFARKSRNLLVAVGDENGDTIALRFFRQTPALEKSLHIGRKLRARGVVRMGRFGWEMAHPKLQSADAPKQAVAIYPSIGKMP
ncbi:MAG: ATP-dependent DNA helicase RecG, partial [Gammaproteobacteria bacterium]